MPALRALRRSLPDHELLLAAPEPMGAFAVAEGLADAAVPVPGLDPPGWPPEPLLGVEVAVGLHGRGPQSSRMLQDLRPGRLVAYAHAAAGTTGPLWREGEPEAARWCRLLVESGTPGEVVDRADLRLRPDPDPADWRWRRDEVAVVHPGAASAARRWPPERFAAVVAALAGRGLEVLVSAGPGEADLAREVAGRRGRVLAAGLGELADVLARARIAVVGDTGVGHLVTACGTPSVRLFGPVDPAVWGPSIDRDRHLVLWRGDGTGDPHADQVDPCVLAINEADALTAVDEVLAR